MRLHYPGSDGPADYTGTLKFDEACGYGWEAIERSRSEGRIGVEIREAGCASGAVRAPKSAKDLLGDQRRRSNAARETPRNAARSLEWRVYEVSS